MCVISNASLTGHEIKTLATTKNSFGLVGFPFRRRRTIASRTLQRTLQLPTLVAGPLCQPAV